MTSTSDKQLIFCIVGSVVVECSLAERGRPGSVSLDDTTYIYNIDDNLDDGPDDAFEEDEVGVDKGMDMIELYF